jgi:hypothetical protein
VKVAMTKRRLACLAIVVAVSSGAMPSSRRRTTTAQAPARSDAAFSRTRSPASPHHLGEPPGGGQRRRSAGGASDCSRRPERCGQFTVSALFSFQVTDAETAPATLASHACPANEREEHAARPQRGPGTRPFQLDQEKSMPRT